MEKLAILTIAHKPDDVRLYYKITKSLNDLFKIVLITKRKSQIFIHKNDNYKYYILSKFFFIKSIHLIYKERIKTIICVEPWTLLLGVLLKYFLKLKIYYDCHEYYAEAFQERFYLPYNLSRKLYFFFETFLIRLVDGVITVNDDQKVMFSPFNKNIIRCANYPVIDQFEEIPNETKKCYDLIYTGGLSLSRGLDILFDALSILKQENIFIKVILIGHFINKEDKEFFMKKQSEEPSMINMIESIPHEQVYTYLKKTKIGLCLLNPKSNRYTKALPLKLLEYLSVGLPVITNNFPIIKDVVKKTGSGLCINYSSVELANSIKIILFDKKEQKKMSQNGINEVILNRRWETEKIKLREFLKNG